MLNSVVERKRSSETRTNQPRRQPRASLKDRRRALLLDAAAACIAESGIERTTMRMVADRAGVTTGMVVYYFRNKRELIDAAMDTAFDVIKANVDEASHSSYGRARLENVLRSAVWDAAGSVSRKLMIQLRKEALTDDEARRSYIGQVDYAREHIAKSVRAGQESGELRTDVDPGLVTDLIYCLMEGIATEEFLNPEDVPSDRALDVSLLLLELLSSSEAQAAPRSMPHVQRSVDTVFAVEGILRSDSALSPEIADRLLSAFRQIYDLSVAINASVTSD